MSQWLQFGKCWHNFTCWCKFLFGWGFFPCRKNYHEPLNCFTLREVDGLDHLVCKQQSTQEPKLNQYADRSRERKCVIILHCLTQCEFITIIWQTCKYKARICGPYSNSAEQFATRIFLEFDNRFDTCTLLQ